MEVAGLLLLFSGGFLDWCAITGRSPLGVLIAISSGGAIPARDSWQSISKGLAVSNAATAAINAVEGIQAAQNGAVGNAANTAIGAVTTVARASVVTYAKSKIGDKYVWDEAGPNTFDCSGLVLAAYKVVGVNLPHLAAGQQKYGKQITLAAAQPGDLVFFNTPASHVGIYIGNGQYIAAPHAGALVGIFNVPNAANVTIRSLLPITTPVTPPDTTSATPGL